MKKILSFLIFSFLSFFATVTVHAEIIRSYDSQITVQKEGTIEVKEKISYDFEYLYKHGIYREIPFLKKNADGKQYKMEIQISGVVDENGVPYEYSTSVVNQSVRIKIGNANRTITGVHTYIISYTVSGAMTYFSDHDELYWNVTGDKWVVPIENASSTIRLPADIAIEDVKSSCFTGVAGSALTNCKANIEQKSTTITSERLGSGEGMTVVVGFPKGHISVLKPTLYTAFEDIWYGKLMLGLLFALLGVLALIWYIILPIYIPIKWYLTGRDPRSESVRVWYDPPQTKSGRKLTPAETGSLVDETVDMKDIFGSLIQLAQKGYFQIVEDKKGEITFVRKNGWTGDS